jgi:hypothetical protein
MQFDKEDEEDGNRESETCSYDDEENEIVELVGIDEGGYSETLKEGEREVEYEGQEDKKCERAAYEE